jgi:hypothetical protein
MLSLTEAGVKDVLDRHDVSYGDRSNQHNAPGGDRPKLPQFGNAPRHQRGVEYAKKNRRQREPPPADLLFPNEASRSPGGPILAMVLLVASKQGAVTNYGTTRFARYRRHDVMQLGEAPAPVGVEASPGALPVEDDPEATVDRLLRPDHAHKRDAPRR